jgi:hypothetical protein
MLIAEGLIPERCKASNQKVHFGAARVVRGPVRAAARQTREGRSMRTPAVRSRQSQALFEPAGLAATTAERIAAMRAATADGALAAVT